MTVWRLLQADESVAQAAASDHQIVLALIAVVASSVAALAFAIRNGSNSRVAAEQATAANSAATAANKAVNGVGPEHRLWDKVDRIEKVLDKLAAEQETFDSHGWETLPPDLNSAVALTTTIRDLQHGAQERGAKIDAILAELREHVAWEMNTKYGDGHRNT